jgi:hypothetical protein
LYTYFFKKRKLLDAEAQRQEAVKLLTWASSLKPKIFQKVLNVFQKPSEELLLFSVVIDCPSPLLVLFYHNIKGLNVTVYTLTLTLVLHLRDITLSERDNELLSILATNSPNLTKVLLRKVKGLTDRTLVAFSESLSQRLISFSCYETATPDMDNSLCHLFANCASTLIFCSQLQHL